ncbi:MAG: cytochrome c3 family protein [Bryobacteraceae bacterium]
MLAAVFTGLCAASQPMPFRHRDHAAAGAQCVECHPGRGARATIAGAASCMRCHRHVAVDSPHIRTLARAAAAGRAIRWERVYEVPDFVHFSHRRHRGAPCTDCHGPVETRVTLEREVVHTMKFCRSCHVKQGAKSACGTCHEEK